MQSSEARRSGQCRCVVVGGCFDDDTECRRTRLAAAMINGEPWWADVLSALFLAVLCIIKWRHPL